MFSFGLRIQKTSSLGRFQTVSYTLPTCAHVPPKSGAEKKRQGVAVLFIGWFSCHSLLKHIHS